MQILADAFFCKPSESISVDLRKRQRARECGLWVARIGFPLALIAAFIDFKWTASAMGVADLILALGLMVSYGVSHLPRYRDRLYWWPGYFAFWYQVNCATLFAGGLYSPFLGYGLVLLLVMGLVFQTRFKPLTVFLFIIANACVWGWINVEHVQWIPHRNMTPIFVLISSLLLVAGVMAFFAAIIRTEKLIEQDQNVQLEKLSETLDALAHTAKMAEIGDLIAGTTHELAQPAQVISANCSMLNRMKEKGTFSQNEVAPFLDRISDASVRMLGLFNRFRDFARKEAFELAALDCRDVLLSVKNVTQFNFQSANVHLDLSLPTHPLKIHGDLVRLQQVFLNLVNNARDHASLGQFPRVSISADEYRDWIRVKVTNSGPGIPPETQQKLFHPYFTTKKRGKGTGLGLSISAKLVEQHGGRIFFSSQSEETVFIIDLPQPGEGSLSQPGLSIRLDTEQKYESEAQV